MATLIFNFILNQAHWMPFVMEWQLCWGSIVPSRIYLLVWKMMCLLCLIGLIILCDLLYLMVFELFVSFYFYFYIFCYYAYVDWIWTYAPTQTIQHRCLHTHCLRLAWRINGVLIWLRLGLRLIKPWILVKRLLGYD